MSVPTIAPGVSLKPFTFEPSSHQHRPDFQSLLAKTRSNDLAGTQSAPTARQQSRPVQAAGNGAASGTSPSSAKDDLASLPQTGQSADADKLAADLKSTRPYGGPDNLNAYVAAQLAKHGLTYEQWQALPDTTYTNPAHSATHGVNWA